VKAHGTKIRANEGKDAGEAGKLNCSCRRWGREPRAANVCNPGVIGSLRIIAQKRPREWRKPSGLGRVAGGHSTALVCDHVTSPVYWVTAAKLHRRAADDGDRVGVLNMSPEMPTTVEPRARWAGGLNALAQGVWIRPETFWPSRR